MVKANHETRSVLIRKTEEFVRRRLQGDTSGHDWYHIARVRSTALRIAQSEEGADLEVVELAALLHDIADWKFHDGDLTAGPDFARQWLKNQGVSLERIELIAHIIHEVSFKGAGVITRPVSLEGQIVQDADRLDAMGAIGVARAFAYGGHRGNPIHIPEKPPSQHATFEQYRSGSSSTINHFHEKLLLLMERMNTKLGRALSQERHAFMVTFLEQFREEWDGRR